MTAQEFNEEAENARVIAEMAGKKEYSIPCTKIPGLEHCTGRNVVIRKLTYGDKADVTDAIFEMQRNGVPKIKLGQLRVFALIYGVREAPFFDGETGILSVNWSEGITPVQFENRRKIARNVDEETGVAILDYFYKLNPGLIQGLMGAKKGSPTASTADQEATSA